MTRFLYSVALTALALFGTACRQKVPVEAVEAKDDYGYTEKYERRKENFARQGLYERFNETGQRVEEAYYENDTLNGLRILYSDKGDTQVVETYRMGHFEGPFRSYYESGKLNVEGQYEADVMFGSWKAFYPTGELKEVVTFADNEENGPFVEYWPNGNLKAEGTYRHGDNEHGLLKLYDESGALSRTMNCDNGVCHTIWKAEGAAEDRTAVDQ
ncbi:MAG: toxin-antitoxin system YwqK family antitoxin [Lewinellaceae bacterium]|nr:toxin-antitoxin system YwqK family antitoxin [Lewinellaceae bacterium]